MVGCHQAASPPEEGQARWIIAASKYNLAQHFNRNWLEYRKPVTEAGHKNAAELFRRGLLVSGTLTSAQTIRIEPPLIIEQADIDEGLNRLVDAVKTVAKSV